MIVQRQSEKINRRHRRPPWPPPADVLQLLRAARSRYWRLAPQNRPAVVPDCLIGLLAAEECHRLHRAGYTLRGQVARFITAEADPEEADDYELARALRALVRSPDVAAAFRAALARADG